MNERLTVQYERMHAKSHTEVLILLSIHKIKASMPIDQLEEASTNADDLMTNPVPEAESEYPKFGTITCIDCCRKLMMKLTLKLKLKQLTIPLSLRSVSQLLTIPSPLRSMIQLSIIPSSFQSTSPCFHLFLTASSHTSKVIHIIQMRSRS